MSPRQAAKIATLRAALDRILEVDLPARSDPEWEAGVGDALAAIVLIWEASVAEARREERRL